MTPRLRALIRQRARRRCEYCHLPEACAELRFQLDHVVPRKHGGPGAPENLAFACFRCNTHKGPNLSGLDPLTGVLTRLFNPRADDWGDHFRWSGPALAGKSAIGRTTISVLAINRPDVVQLRRFLLLAGVDFR